jgi:hypothetical protein
MQDNMLLHKGSILSCWDALHDRFGEQTTIDELAALKVVIA